MKLEAIPRSIITTGSVRSSSTLIVHVWSTNSSSANSCSSGTFKISGGLFDATSIVTNGDFQKKIWNVFPRPWPKSIKFPFSSSSLRHALTVADLVQLPFVTSVVEQSTLTTPVGIPGIGTDYSSISAVAVHSSICVSSSGSITMYSVG